MPKRQDSLEIVRKKVSMSQQISRKDKQYALYAGAYLDDAETMAKIDTILEFGLIPKEFVPVVEFLRAYLDRRRKAFFASVGCSEISKLGFMLGMKVAKIKATK